MPQKLWGTVLVVCALATAACTGSAHESESMDRPGVDTGAAAQATPGGMAHGDHTPHHGGTVYMYDDMHYEVVLDPGGHHRVFFTDSAREDLPAAAASGVTLTLERPKAEPEVLTGQIDPQGESWLLDGQPVSDAETNVRVAFVTKAGQYWIDVPFIPPGQ